jgi:hypothetical protein
MEWFSTWFEFLFFVFYPEIYDENKRRDKNNVPWCDYEIFIESKISLRFY